MEKRGRVTSEKVISMLARCMPNSEQIDWNSIGDTEIRFTWRSNTFRVSTESLFVEECRDSFLVGSDSAALISMLLKKQMVMESSR